MLPFVYLVSFLFKGPLAAYATTVFVLSVVSMVRPVTFIDDIVEFTQLNRDYHWLMLGQVTLTKFECIPIVIQFSNCTPHVIEQYVIKACWTVVLPPSSARETRPVFTFENERNNIMKPKAKKHLVFSKSSKLRCGVFLWKNQQRHTDPCMHEIKCLFS